MSTRGVRPSHRAGPQLFERQRQLLALLADLGGRADNVDFQKLLFLYCQELGATAPYEFVPYRFGAFSFTSYADRRKLIDRRLLANDDHDWQLTDEGSREDLRSSLGGAQRKTIVQRYAGVRGDALARATYRAFPTYATRSEIASRVLRGDVAALERIQACQPLAPAALLATIGYEGRMLEGFLNTLLQAGVTLLCDVRRNPLSRKYGFSKGTLSKGCEGVGIRHEHVPELGIPSDQRQALETQADYDALFETCERERLPMLGPALGKLHDWIRSGERMALTCYESLPMQCHRHCVSEALERRLGDGFAAVHA